MARIDYQSIKEQIRQAIDIVDLASGYLSLQREGRAYKAHCPWHDDSRPSLQIHPERQSFKCWVCNVGGDIFSFVMKIENIEFREALEMLAERAGVALAPTPTADKESPYDRRRLLQATAWAETQFHQCLLHAPEAEPARRYLTERGIDDASVQRFQIGFAPAEWDWLVRRAAKDGIAPESLERVDCLVRREQGGYYDRFRGRLMFSIRDVRSRAIAFGGRTLPELARPDDAKYINSRETPLFNKSSQLYGLDLARETIPRSQGVVVMEGYTDVVMAHQYGVRQAVAVLGTALGERHVHLLRRFTDRIALVLDGDAAGKGRTLDIIDNLLALFIAQEIDLRILTLPEGADPCDVIRTQGSDAFNGLLTEAKDALTHKIEAVTQGLAPASDPHRAARAVESILATMARALPHAVAASTAFVREQQTLVRIARQFGVPHASLQSRLDALRNERRSKLRFATSRTSPARSGAPQTAGNRSPAGLAGRDAGAQEPTSLACPTSGCELSAWEREFFELMIHEPAAREPLLHEAGETDFTTWAGQTLYRLLREQTDRGEAPTFAALMLATDDAELKNLLVDCDEKGREKTLSDAAQRVTGLLSALAARRGEPQRRAWMAELSAKQLAPDDEVQTLNALFKELKSRQAGVSPTDG